MIEEPVSPLVLTKLRVPATRSRMISRMRLVNLLAPEDAASFILVCAPAGYGKTTLLADWVYSVLRKGTAVAWVTLDPSDDDPIPFMDYLVAGFIEALGPIPELTQVAQLLRSLPEVDIQRFLPTIINTVVSSDRECLLVLDDYHLIGSPAVHNALAYLIDHLPENLRIAIGSRSDPPLPLARLRARRQLLEIRTASLRFTIEETTQFLNEVLRLDLSTKSVSALEDRTEGWIAGLQLAALSLSGSADKESLIAAFTGSQRYLVDYLMEEVVNRQTDEIQSFLLSTSILERMCGDLCDAVRDGRTGGTEILYQLEQANLFVVALDDQGMWYRYHHLFQDFLQARLNKALPDQINGLHRAACDWLAAKNLLREAAWHAFQTQDWEYAAAFVEQYSFSLIVHSEIATIYEWCSAFPEEVMQRRPMLCILQGLALAYGFQRQNRVRVEARLQRANQMIAKMENRQLARTLIDLASVVRTFLAMAPDPGADPQELLTLAKGILEAYPEGDASQFSGFLLKGYADLALQDAEAAGEAFGEARQIALRERLYFGIVESTFHLARLAHSQGQLHQAEDLCVQGKAEIETMLAHPEQELPALGCLDIAYGCVLMEQDHLDSAEQHLRYGLDLMGGGMNPYYLMTAYLALFRLYEVQNRSAEAIICLDRLEAIWPDLAFCTGGLRAMHVLDTSQKDPGRLADIENWSHHFSSTVSEATFLPGVGPLGAAEAYYLASTTWVRAQLTLGQPQAAIPYLTRQLDLAKSHGLTNRVIELSLMEAQAWRAQGELQRSQVALEKALMAAQPAGYVRIFDQGPGLIQLLVEAEEQGVCLEHIERILNHIGRTEISDRGQEGPAGRSPQGPFGESLSERELDVLRLIAQGATNYEISEQLVITVGTVKSHINHILGKLDAHNRTEAVARARESGLLKI